MSSVRDYKTIILKEAKLIAEEEGLSKVNIRKVAKNSDVAIGTVYNYFPSKSDLLIAVVENFWNTAFSDINWREELEDDFFNNLRIIYDILYIKLSKFKKNWLKELGMLKSEEKDLGRQREELYFKKIHKNIMYLMKVDDNINRDLWDEEFSREEMAEFIFENMLNYLRKDRKDIEFFIRFLKSALSKNSIN